MTSQAAGSQIGRQAGLPSGPRRTGGSAPASVKLKAGGRKGCGGHDLRRGIEWPLAASIAMTTLDGLLYAWLAESDESRFLRAFNAYFGVAYPAVIRHLARIAPSDPALLEEIAQDALLRFFERIGLGRRLALETVEQGLNLIRPLPFGPFHESQVAAWTSDVSDYRATVMAFRPAVTEQEVAGALQNTVRELALRIPSLQSRGWRLIDRVRVELRWEPSSESVEPKQTEMHAAVAGVAVEADTGVNGGSVGALLQATAEFVTMVLQSAASAAVIDRRFPGAQQFVRGTASVVGALPRLRVPSNGYLFETAMSLYLDDYRRRGRQKRGGAGARGAPDAALQDSEGGPIGHPLDLSLPDEQGNEAYVPAPSASVGHRSISDRECADSDPIGRLEDAEFFERFHDYLREPLAAAEQAYEAARARGRAIAEQRKRDSLAQKFSRIIQVLSTIGEGYTQEETAQRLGLSRNQVKYVIESLQEAYERFTAQAIRSPSRRQSGGVASHAE